MKKSFDHLLRETLYERANPAGDCLDAETIAGWFDGSLARHDRTAAEAHMANCPRCQAMFAAMARTAPPPVPRARWHSIIRWVVPLTVAAASVLVWVNVREPADLSPSVATSPAEVSMSGSAQNQAAPGPSIEREVAAPADRADRQAQPTPRMRSTRNEAAAKPPALPTDAVAGESTAPATPAAPTPPMQAAGSASSPERDSAARAFVAGATPSPAPMAQPPAPAALAETVTVAGAEPVSATLRSAPPQVVIASMDGPTRWRITSAGPGSTVQRSTNGGRTWETQATGVTMTLTAGASPSRSICWLVGRAGIVLITTDGRTWQRVDFPEVVDLVSIRATDDQTATVTAIDGRVFTTTNRGRTWSR